MLSIDLCGELVHLLPERALWWPKEKTLVVADLHWGKGGHFRKNGIAIPVQAQQDDEARLSRLIQQRKADRVVIAGDLFHSSSNQQVEIFAHFRNAHASVHLDLVVGNHDILKGEQYDRYGLAQHQDCFVLAPFCIAHDMCHSEHFVLHGHIHPALRIKSQGYHQAAVRLACFAQMQDRMVLPAFGRFTGTHLLEPKALRHAYVVADDEVIQWK